MIEEEKTHLTLIGCSFKIWTTDVDALSDLQSYISDKFGSSLWHWM